MLYIQHTLDSVCVSSVVEFKISNTELTTNWLSWQMTDLAWVDFSQTMNVYQSKLLTERFLNESQSWENAVLHFDVTVAWLFGERRRKQYNWFCFFSHILSLGIVPFSLDTHYKVNFNYALGNNGKIQGQGHNYNIYWGETSTPFK